MTPYQLPVSCPDCAGPLHLLNARATGLVSLAILACPACEWEWEVLMRIERHAPMDTPEAREREKNRRRKARQREKVSA